MLEASERSHTGNRLRKSVDIGVMSIGSRGEEVGSGGVFRAEANGIALGTEVKVIDEGDADDVEAARLKTGDGSRGFVNRDAVDHVAIQKNLVLMGAFVFLLLGLTPVYNGSISLDSGQVDEGSSGNIEAKELGEFFKWFVQDLIGAVDKPCHGNEDDDGLEVEGCGNSHAVGQREGVRQPYAVREGEQRDAPMAGVGQRVGKGEDGGSLVLHDIIVLSRHGQSVRGRRIVASEWTSSRESSRNTVDVGCSSEGVSILSYSGWIWMDVWRKFTSSLKKLKRRDSDSQRAV